MNKRQLSSALFAFFTGSVFAAPPRVRFQTVNLPFGASVQLPDTWEILNGKKMQSVATAVQALVELTTPSSTDEHATLLFARFPDPDLYASISITTTRIQGVSKSTIFSITLDEMTKGDAQFKSELERSQAKLSTKISDWTRSQKISIGDATLLHISYVRHSKSGSRRVKYYRYFATDRVFEMAATSAIEVEMINMVVLERIVSSFRVA